MDFSGTLLTIVCIFALFTVVTLVVGSVRLMGLRLKPDRAVLAGDASLPEDHQIMLRGADAVLCPLGFQYSHSMIVTGLVGLVEKQKVFRVFHDPITHAYALVVPPTQTDGAAAFRVHFSTLLDDDRVLETVAGIGHLLLPECPNVEIVDAGLVRIEDQWDAHRRRLPRRGLWMDAETHVAFYNIMNEKGFAYRLAEKLIVPAMPEGTCRFTVLGATRIAARTIAKSRAKSRAKRPPRPSGVSDGAIVLANAEAFTDLQDALRSSAAQRGPAFKMLLFAVTGGLFVLAFALGNRFETLGQIMVILVIHEFGHLAGMRICGYRDRQIFFLPFLGAAAMGTKENATAAQRLLVLLLGPMPGIVIGLVLMATSGRWPAWLNEYAMFSVAINYINLLPVLPLDGGRILEVLLPRAPIAPIVLQIASALLLGLSAFTTGDRVLFFLGLLIVLSLPATWNSLRVAERARRFLPPGSTADPMERIRAVFWAMNTPALARIEPPKRFNVAKSALDRIPLPPTGVGARIGGIFTYIGALLFPWFAVVGYGVYLGLGMPIGLFGGASPAHYLDGMIRSATNTHQRVAARAGKAQWLARAGRGAEADQLWSQALDEAIAEGNRVDLSLVLHSMGFSQTNRATCQARAEALLNHVAAEMKSNDVRLVCAYEAIGAWPALEPSARRGYLQQAISMLDRDGAITNELNAAPLLRMAQLDLVDFGDLASAEQHSLAYLNACAEPDFARGAATDVLMEIALRRGDYDAAENIVRKWLAGPPDADEDTKRYYRRETLARLAWIRLQRGDYASALAMTDESSHLKVAGSERMDDASPADPLLDQCVIQHKAGHEDLARSAFKSAMETDTHHFIKYAKELGKYNTAPPSTNLWYERRVLAWTEAAGAYR